MKISKVSKKLILSHALHCDTNFIMLVVPLQRREDLWIGLVHLSICLSMWCDSFINCHTNFFIIIIHQYQVWSGDDASVFEILILSILPDISDILKQYHILNMAQSAAVKVSAATFVFNWYTFKLQLFRW